MGNFSPYIRVRMLAVDVQSPFPATSYVCEAQTLQAGTAKNQMEFPLQPACYNHRQCICRLDTFGCPARPLCR